MWRARITPRILYLCFYLFCRGTCQPTSARMCEPATEIIYWKETVIFQSDKKRKGEKKRGGKNPLEKQRKKSETEKDEGCQMFGVRNNNGFLKYPKNSMVQGERTWTARRQFNANSRGFFSFTK